MAGVEKSEVEFSPQNVVRGKCMYIRVMCVCVCVWAIAVFFDSGCIEVVRWTSHSVLLKWSEWVYTSEGLYGWACVYVGVLVCEVFVSLSLTTRAVANVRSHSLQWWKIYNRSAQATLHIGLRAAAVSSCFPAHNVVASLLAFLIHRF